ncbi:hypothetical protein ACA910_016944 [Epithemia clementina (nom. ined.)]
MCSNSWSLERRNFLITGGSDGIGLAIVREFLSCGAETVIFCSRREAPDLLLSLQQSFPGTAARIFHVACDVATEGGRKTLFEATKQSVDVLHGLVNNVGMNVRKPISEQTVEEYNKIMQTNIDSAYFLTKLLLDLLDTQNGATIVNVSSVAGEQSSGTGAVYGMSKAAMNQMTRSLACELACRNIRVNAVAPGQTMTPKLEEAVQRNPSLLDKAKAWTPLHRLANLQEVAAPVVFLSMPCSSYISGQILGVDGGRAAQGFDGPCNAHE